MLEASAKYRTGTGTSPSLKPNETACARNWLSKTKSSELRSKGIVSRTFARIRPKPGMEIPQVLSQRDILDDGQNAVRNVFVDRHAAGQRFCRVRMREPTTQSQIPSRRISTATGISRLSYW